jgi:hypothetical protein
MADSENLHNPHNASVVSVFGPVAVDWACNSKWGKQQQHYFGKRNTSGNLATWKHKTKMLKL